MAISKAQSEWSNSARIFDLPVIGADTIVMCDDKILGKPNNKKEGIAMLTTVSGRVHQVITAVAIVYATQVKQCYVESEIIFTTLTASEIEIYWNTGKSCDKAGADAIQGRAAAFITYLTDSYSGAVVLPLFEAINLLHEYRSMTFNFIDQTRNITPANYTLNDQHQPKYRKKNFSRPKQCSNTKH